MSLPGEVSAPSHPPCQQAALTHDRGDTGDLLLGWEQLHTYQAAAGNAAMLIPWKRSFGKALQVKGVQPLLRGQVRAAAALQPALSPSTAPQPAGWEKPHGTMGLQGAGMECHPQYKVQHQLCRLLSAP